VKALIEIKYTIDGVCDDQDKIIEAFCRAFSVQYIGSEEIDGTDEWGVEFQDINITLETEKTV